MKLFRAREAATILGISKQTLIRYEKRGILPKQRRNHINSWREYTQEDIEDLKQRLKKGITLLELIMVMIIAGILASAAIPRLRGLETVKVSSASKVLAQDMRYVQQYAMTRHLHTRIVFNLTNESYYAQEENAANSSAWVNIKSPFTRANMTLDFTRDPRFAGTLIDSANFSGQTNVTFNWTGAPAGGGSVAVSFKGVNRTVTVENETGLVRLK